MQGKERNEPLLLSVMLPQTKFEIHFSFFLHNKDVRGGGEWP